MADLHIFNCGSIIRMIPTSRRGARWVLDRIPNEGYQPTYPRAILIEPRYIEAIVEAASSDGLNVGG